MYSVVYPCVTSDMTPCSKCIVDHDMLVDRRQKELAVAVIETIKDGHESDIPENVSEEISRDIHHEMRRRERAKIRRAAIAHNVLNASRGTVAEIDSVQSDNTSSRTSLFFGMISRSLYKSLSRSFSGSYRKLDVTDRSIRTAPSGEDCGNLGHSTRGDILLDPPSTPEPRESGPPKRQEKLEEKYTNGDAKPVDEVDVMQRSAPSHLLIGNSESPSAKSEAKSKSPPPLSASRSGPALSVASTALAMMPSVPPKLESFGPKHYHSRISSLKVKDIIPSRPSDAIYCCMIEHRWLEKWKFFVQAGNFEDIEFPFEAPGPISNYRLLQKDSPHRREHTRFLRINGMEAEKEFVYTSGIVLNAYVLSDLHPDRDYDVISPGVWSALLAKYGGGPAIFREDISIYSKEYSHP